MDRILHRPDHDPLDQRVVLCSALRALSPIFGEHLVLRSYESKLSGIIRVMASAPFVPVPPILGRTLTSSKEEEEEEEAAAPPEVTNYFPIIFEEELTRTIPVVTTYTRFDQFKPIDYSNYKSYPIEYSHTVSNKIYKVIGTKQIKDTLIAMVALFKETAAGVVQEPFSPLIVVKVEDKANTTEKARVIYDAHLVPVSPMREAPPPDESKIKVVVHNSGYLPPFRRVTAIPPHKMPAGGARKKKTMRKHKKTRKYRRSNRRRAFKRDGL